MAALSEDMAPSKGDSEPGPASDDQKPIYEWTLPNPARMLVTNRSIGSPSTINIFLTFPTPASLDIPALTARLAQVQELWPFLCATVVDQRTPCPKVQHRASIWDTEQILAYETYTVKADDPKAERDALYDSALRLFQTKVSFDYDPLWRVTIFRASSNPDQSRLYLALTLDHVFLDGRGAVKLAQALLAPDISQLPKEDIKLYEKTYYGSDATKKPPYSAMVSFIVQELLYARLPVFMQRWLGYYPLWPQKITQPTIDCPWKSSILDISSDLTAKLKEAGKRHGVSTLNPTLHTAWIVAIWAVLARKEAHQAIRDMSIKDLRDTAKGDPYCLAGRATMYLWSTGSLTAESRFWPMAQSYAAVSVDQNAYAHGMNQARILNLLKDKLVDPEISKYRAPDSLELPAGDKRAYTKNEENALKKINSLSPYFGISGIWSNLSYFSLPKGATDMIFGVSGNATGTAFNTCLVGHENGVRYQNAYSDGAAMREDQVKEAERVCLKILEAIVCEDDNSSNWSLSDLLDG